jgi:dTMP kinase
VVSVEAFGGVVARSIGSTRNGMARGRLITIEGIDGAGKTTLGLALVSALQAQGIDAKLLREPGGVRTAELIRTLVKDPELRIGPRAEALLYAAARAQLVEEAVEPLLADGVYVLLDRFVDSSLAYQGAGRGLGIAAVRTINEFATRSLTPDVTLLLSVDPSLGRRRSQERPAPSDRLEREQGEFFERIAAAYGELAEASPERIRTLDGSQPPGVVLERALAEIREVLERAEHPSE